MHLLSLDISTTTTGYCLWKDGEIIEAGAFQTKSEEIPDKFDKIDCILSSIQKLLDRHNVRLDKFAAESALEKFATGKTNAKTMTALIGFNFCLCYAISRKFSCKGDMINVLGARSAAGIKIPKGLKDKKQYIAEIICKRFPDLPWEKKKTGAFKDWNCDMADAVVIGLASISKMAQPG